MSTLLVFYAWINLHFTRKAITGITIPENLFYLCNLGTGVLVTIAHISEKKFGNKISKRNYYITIITGF